MTLFLCVPAAVYAQNTTKPLPPQEVFKAKPADLQNQLTKELFPLSEKLNDAQTPKQQAPTRQDRILRNVILTLAALIITYIFIFGLITFINNRVKDIKARHVVRKNIVYFSTFTCLLVVLFIWVQHVTSITILLGVAGAGITLALQEVILGVAGWFLILIRRPFEIGDRIELNGIKGDIIDIRLFQTSLLEIGNWVDADQSTGRIVNIPNSFVFKEANYNYSRGFEFIWHELPILVTFESDWKLAKQIMETHAKKLAEGMEDEVRRKIDAMRNRYMIYYGKLSPIVYVNIKDSGVELTLRYLTEAKRRRSSQDNLCQNILEDFAKEPTVNFAYPTYRIVKE
ncbi:MAG: mechanosensitive ion channel family protein [Candidatus Omnitrophica bacterium]|nr:mechanosensitive ion channel family protein [Candidatus Omnitrophota bacterium]